MAARAETAPAAPLVMSNLVWDAMEKSVDVPAMTNWVYCTFFVTNHADQNITVLSTETSCDCAVAETSEKLPWTVAPGAGGSLNVRVNTKGRYGEMMRQVAVYTS